MANTDTYRITTCRFGSWERRILTPENVMVMVTPLTPERERELERGFERTLERLTPKFMENYN